MPFSQEISVFLEIFNSFVISVCFKFAFTLAALKLIFTLLFPLVSLLIMFTISLLYVENNVNT